MRLPLSLQICYRSILETEVVVNDYDRS